MAAGRRRRLFVALLVVALAFALAVLPGCMSDDIETPTSQIDIAKDAAMKVSILSVETGIQAYIAMNGQLPPTADQNSLGGFVQPWPENPYTKVPMKPGTNPGEYTYTPQGGNSYTLVAHLSGGQDYTR